MGLNDAANADKKRGIVTKEEIVGKDLMSMKINSGQFLNKKVNCTDSSH